MYIKTSKKWQNVLEFSMIILGTLIMGFSFSVFLEPNDISTGGFSALSMIINTLLQKVRVKGIPTSAIYLILNIGLYALALKTLGKKFAIKALLGIISFSLGMQIFKYNLQGFLHWGYNFYNNQPVGMKVWKEG